MSNRSISLFFVAILVLSSSSRMIGQNANVTIDFSTPTGTGSPLIFGTSKQPADSGGLAALQAAGVTIVRVDLSLNTIVPNDTIYNYQNNANDPVRDAHNWNWSSYWNNPAVPDNAGGVFHDAHFKVLVILDYAPTWLVDPNCASNSGNPSNCIPSANWSIWQELVTNAFTYLAGQYDYVEIWNEPANFLNWQYPGSPYSSYQAAYDDLYQNSAPAVRRANSAIPVGGPVSECGPCQSDAVGILSNTTSAGSTGFLSFHDYNGNDGTVYQELLVSPAYWLPIAAQYQLPNLPIVISEWNYGGNSLLNGSDPHAVSLVGRDLSDMMNSHVAVATQYNDAANTNYAFLDSNEHLLPRDWPYRLMSVDLGLGAGPSTVVLASNEVQSAPPANGGPYLCDVSNEQLSNVVLTQQVSTPLTLAATGGAMNYFGNPVVWLVNDVTTSQTFDLTLAGLTGTTGVATFYVAGDVDYASDASTPGYTTTITPTNGQYTFPSVSVPSCSVTGVIVRGLGTATSTIGLGQTTVDPVAHSSNPGADATGFVSDGQPFVGTGINGQSQNVNAYTYSSNLVGTSLIDPEGIRFSLGKPGQSNTVLGAVPQTTSPATIISFPAGRYEKVKLLGAGANGFQPNQQLAINYADGSSSSFKQGFSLFYKQQPQSDETILYTFPTFDHYDPTSGDAEPYNGPASLFEYSFPIDPTRQVSGLSLPANPNVFVAGVTLLGYGSAAPPSPTQVSMASVANATGIYSDGTTFSTTGGLDGQGYAYSATLLGASLNYGGITYAFGPANQKNVVISPWQISLPEGHYSVVSFLGTGVNGNQPGGTFTVHYDDGTADGFNVYAGQSVSDWYSPQSYPGENVAATLAYRDTSSGGTDHRPFNLYQYSLSVNPLKMVEYLDTPYFPPPATNTNDIAIVAITLLP